MNVSTFGAFEVEVAVGVFASYSECGVEYLYRVNFLTLRRGDISTLGVYIHPVKS